VRVVLKKSKVGVAGGDDMRNSEIHMNRRLQVFPLVHVFRVRMLHLPFSDTSDMIELAAYGSEAFDQSMHECIYFYFFIIFKNYYYYYFSVFSAILTD
jgi:hypothetical protein